MLFNNLVKLAAAAVLVAPVLSAPHPRQQLQARAEDVQNPYGNRDDEGTNYWITESGGNGDLGVDKTWEVRSHGFAGGNDVLGKFAFKDDRAYVLAAWNKDDKTEGDNKKSMRDLLIGAWVHTNGRSAGDLKSVYYYMIIEEDVEERAEEAWGIANDEDDNDDNGWDKEGELFVKKDDGDDKKKKAFEKMNDTGFLGIGGNVFANGISKMLETYFDDRSVWQWAIYRRPDEELGGLHTSAEVFF